MLPDVLPIDGPRSHCTLKETIDFSHRPVVSYFRWKRCSRLYRLDGISESNSCSKIPVNDGDGWQYATSGFARHCGGSQHDVQGAPQKWNAIGFFAKAVDIGHHDDCSSIFQCAKRYAYPSGIRVDDARAASGVIEEPVVQVVEQFVACMVLWVAIEDVDVTRRWRMCSIRRTADRI